MKTKNILTTFHGSQLYGMSTPESDIDIYSIYEFLNHRYRPYLRKQAKQKITTNENQTEDTMTVSWERFAEFCIKGVPQACEVLFSQPEHWIEVGADWIGLSENLKKQVTSKVNLPNVLNTYKRTAHNFITQDDFKKNRHAMRLCINAQQLLTTGVMNPTFSPGTVSQLTEYAMLPYEYRLEVIKNKFLPVFDVV